MLRGRGPHLEKRCLGWLLLSLPSYFVPGNSSLYEVLSVQVAGVLSVSRLLHN